MQSIGIAEAKNNFSALIDLVEKGEEVRITRHGKEVVRMLPVRRKPVITDEQIARELQQIQALQQTVRAPDATNSAATMRQTGRSQA
ncbi:type II toxin-antitoxin system [compost metagenome]